VELYFNPYPGPASDYSSGLNAVLCTAGTLVELKKSLNGFPTVGVYSTGGADNPPINFVMVRNSETGELFDIRSFLSSSSLQASDREKLLFLLREFDKGRILDESELKYAEDWIIAGIEAPAPVLEIAAKRKAIAVTFATETGWDVDIINFVGKEEYLHNLWGQGDVSALKALCLESINNESDRFALGGFYHKNQGVRQSASIDNAVRRINTYTNI
jgi:hypothetical protein